ncbi:metallophosphoesterase [Streptomyces sp. NPDC007084]|uniref:metallophosphoesterase n=1 Tax=Streptomyces sp. NPDC007084 TaxID=3154313 RepID=UPI003456DC76
MVVVFVLVGVAVLAVLGGFHRYAWRRLVRDTTAGPGTARRAGTALFVAGPLLMLGAVVSERAGAPFWLQRVLGWPGFLWMALALYLFLALLVGELARPLLRRALDRRDGARRATVTDADAEHHAGAHGTETQAGAHATPAPGSLRTQAPSTTPAHPDPAPTTPAHPEPAATASERPDPTPPNPADPTPTRPADPTNPVEPTPTGTHPDSPRPDSPLPPPSRRLFVSRVVGGAVAAAAVGTVGYGTYGVLRGPSVKRVTVPLAKLPRSAHGFRIAVVSDIHLGPVLGRGFAQKVVDTINSTQPDLIAVVGDLVDGSVKNLGPAAAPLAGLRARHGSWFVTGNHEYFSGAEQWVREVRELGIHPLENARTELAGFDLAGVNDVQGESEGHGPDFGKALGDRDTARACVLLAHQPVQIHDAVRHGVDLQLSGHTHGGQLWPGNLVAAAANPTVAGLERYGDTQLYVSRGAGAWGPPTRVGAPSDITVVELASRQA